MKHPIATEECRRVGGPDFVYWVRMAKRGRMRTYCKFFTATTTTRAVEHFVKRWPRRQIAVVRERYSNFLFGTWYHSRRKTYLVQAQK